MRVVREISLKDFEFWSGAKQTAELLTDADFELLENCLDDIAYCNGEPMTETAINDFFWFDTYYIAELLGYEDFEALYEDRKN